MKILRTGTESFSEKLDELINRRFLVLDRLAHEADNLIHRYRQGRQEALVEFAKQFDGVALNPEDLWVDIKHIKNSHRLISSSLRQSIDHTIERVKRYQAELQVSSFQTREESGLYWGVEVRPLERVGIYVPHSYFLTLIITAVPAIQAGVSELVVASPPKKKFGAPYVDPALLYTAKALGISRILVSGGVGALSALAFGSSQWKPVEKIAGPGSKLINVAKQRLSGYVGIDGLAGPSEIAFVCDKTSSVRSVAADIVGLADHNPEGDIYVFHHQEPWMEALVDAVSAAIENLREDESRRSVQACLEKNTHFFLVKNFERAIELVNQLVPGVAYMPVEGAQDKVRYIRNCGTLLLGKYTPPVSIDLIGGATGLVSTMGTALFSHLMTSPQTFMRQFSVVELQREALERLQKESLELSRSEGFSTHSEVFSSRLEEI